MQNNISVKFPLSMEWENTRRLQELVWNIIRCSTTDEDLADSISMVSTELLENAHKYCFQTSDNQNFILFSLLGSDNEIVVEIKNKISKDQADEIENLEQMIQWIRGHQSPFEAYVERLKSVSRTAGGESRLGLVRMAYEADALLDFYIDEDTIAVSATLQLN